MSKSNVRVPLCVAACVNSMSERRTGPEAAVVGGVVGVVGVTTAVGDVEDEDPPPPPQAARTNPERRTGVNLIYEFIMSSRRILMR